VDSGAPLDGGSAKDAAGDSAVAEDGAAPDAGADAQVACPVTPTCISYLGDLWSGECLVDPGKKYAKTYSLQSFTFLGKPSLAVDMGDELQFFDLSTAQAPKSTGWSFFKMPAVGDAEHLLYQFSVGDEARYAFTVHRTGVVILDLGTGSAPGIGWQRKWFLDSGHPTLDELDYAGTNFGGMMFAHAGESYLLTSVFDDACANQAALYRLSTGSTSIELELVECVDFPPGSEAVGVQGGRKVGNLLYVALNKSNSAKERRNVTIFELTDPGPKLVAKKVNVFTGNLARHSSFELDVPAGLIAEADAADKVVHIYAAGHQGVGSWDAPELLSSVSVPTSNKVWPALNGPRNVALHWPMLWVDGGGLYDVGDPMKPTQVLAAEDYFHREAGGPQNTSPNYPCLNIYPGAFHPDGTAFYLARFPALQMFDTAACGACK
jgi:hypothetical protein